MSRELYVYWRLATEQVPQAVMAMASWHGDLIVRHPGLQARLLRQACGSGESAALTTLMEIYVRAGGIDPPLQHEIVAEGAQIASGWCQGVRHVEVFEPLAR